MSCNGCLNHHRFLLLIVSGLVFAIAAPRLGAQSPTTGLQLVYAYYFFANNDSTTLVEFAYQFSNRGVMCKTEEDGVSRGRVFFRLVLRPSNSPGNDSLISEWGNLVDSPSPDDTIPRAVMAVRRIGLPSGPYSATLYVTDLYDTTRTGSSTFQFEVPAYRRDAFKVSSLQLAEQLYRKDDPNSPFSKNGHMVVPNIVAEVRGELPMVSSYLEVYNGGRSGADAMEVVYQLAVAANKRIFYERVDTLTAPFPPAFILTDHLPLDSLATGDYILIVRVYDGLQADGAPMSMSSAGFRLFDANTSLRIAARDRASGNDNAASPPGLFIEPFFAGMTESELDKEWSKARYIATVSESNVWESLSGPEAKARHLSQFWQVRDDVPETPENEYRAAYYKRAEEARNRYSSTMAPDGWTSDPGRILLTYGQPDGVDRHPQDFNTRPYEIWSYTSLGYQFVFVDRSQTGHYVIVHSNAPHETTDENWLERYALLNKKWTNE